MRKKKPKDAEQMMGIARRIRALRIASGIHPTVVARLVGMSRVGYLNWETGQAAPPWDRLLQLAKVFDTTVDFILGVDSSVPGRFARAKHFWKRYGCMVEEVESGNVRLTLVFPIRVDNVGGYAVRSGKTDTVEVLGKQDFEFVGREEFFRFTDSIDEKVKKYQLAEALSALNDRY